MLFPRLFYSLVAITSVHGLSVPDTPIRSLHALGRRTDNAGAGESGYNYTFTELRPDSDGRGSNQQPYSRFVILFKRNPNVTEEYFHQHWKTMHADLSIAGKNVGVDILRYVQVGFFSSS
jgi:hypothetical protein